MKVNKMIYITIIILLVINSTAISQLSDENWDLMLIREDKVYPSMTADYEITLLELKEFLSSKDITGFNYFTHMQDDYIFTHVIPIQQLEELSQGIHSFLAEQVNDPKLDLILDYLNDAIVSYRYYIVQYRPEFSYVPEGDDWGEGSPYRKWSFYFFQPGTESEVESVLSSWKYLYKEKGINTGFRVFSGFLGIEQPLYILTTWAEDPLDYHGKLQNTSGTLGEEGAVLWTEMMQFVEKVETIEGWFLPQFSFAPGMQMAQ